MKATQTLMIYNPEDNSETPAGRATPAQMDASDQNLDTGYFLMDLHDGSVVRDEACWEAQDAKRRDQLVWAYVRL